MSSICHLRRRQWPSSDPTGKHARVERPDKRPISAGVLCQKQSQYRYNSFYDANRGMRAAGNFRGQPSGLRAMTTVRCLALGAAVAVALAAAPLLMAAPAGAQIKWNLPSAYPADNFHSENLSA